MSFQILSYDNAGQAAAGIRVGDTIYDAARLTGNSDFSSVLGLLDSWPAALASIDAALASPDGAACVQGARLLAPIPHPGLIYAAGANYQDHIDEMVAKGFEVEGPNSKQAGGKPWHYVKGSRDVVVGPGYGVPIPCNSQKFDWEIELAVVIGRECAHATLDNALDYVAGYTIADDLSARDKVVRPEYRPGSPFYFDMLSVKTFTGSCPMGPWITLARDIPDPMNLGLKLWVDGRLMQDSNTSKMIFDIAEQIVELSSKATLLPGDVVLTGTAAGVGVGHDIFLKPGQEIRLWIESIGEFSHSIVETKGA